MIGLIRHDRIVKDNVAGTVITFILEMRCYFLHMYTIKTIFTGAFLTVLYTDYYSIYYYHINNFSTPYTSQIIKIKKTELT